MKSLRKMFWNYGELWVIVVMFLVFILTNTFWVAILPPWAYVTWPVTAQIFYWWASPRWNDRFPRVTKSNLRGEISRLNHQLLSKDEIIKGYFKVVMNLQEEVRRLKKEIGTEKT